jgi:4a-hydroxytetrahydrobiopterin dehydratase
MRMNSPRRALNGPAVVTELAKLSGWTLHGEGPAIAIEKEFRFHDFHHTMAFVNAVAFIAHQKNHHPDMQVTFDRCTIRWSTHDVQGLTAADFSCAALVDGLLP